MDILLLLAQEAPPPSGVPGGILGPLGLLVACIAVIVWTYTKHIPNIKTELRGRYDKVIADLNAKLESAEEEEAALREKASVNREALREKLEAKEEEAEKAASKWRSKYEKERAMRIHWETSCRNICDRHKEKAPEPPRDADRTFYGE